MMRQERMAEKQTERWAGGAILIGLGIIFLMGNYTGYYLHNWWALFILIPAVASLTKAATIYRDHDGQFTPAMRGPMIGGMVFVLIAVTFLFDLSWAIIGPAILIAIGASMLLTPAEHDA